MKQSLTKGLDKEQAVDVRAAFLSSLPLRKQLIKILEERIEATRKNMCLREKHSETGDWALKMADTMGYERSHRELICLLEEKSENN